MPSRSGARHRLQSTGRLRQFEAGHGPRRRQMRARRWRRPCFANSRLLQLPRQPWRGAALGADCAWRLRLAWRRLSLDGWWRPALLSRRAGLLRLWRLLCAPAAFRPPGDPAGGWSTAATERFVPPRRQDPGFGRGFCCRGESRSHFMQILPKRHAALRMPRKQLRRGRVGNGSLSELGHLSKRTQRNPP